jgi:hypothetical protein
MVHEGCGLPQWAVAGLTGPALSLNPQPGPGGEKFLHNTVYSK